MAVRWPKRPFLVVFWYKSWLNMYFPEKFVYICGAESDKCTYIE